VGTRRRRKAMSSCIYAWHRFEPCILRQIEAGREIVRFSVVHEDRFGRGGRRATHARPMSRSKDLDKARVESRSAIIQYPFQSAIQ